MTSRILFVFTSADTTLTGAPTGYYLPEAAHPYYILSPHHVIDFASPAGPNPPLDPESVESFKHDGGCIKFLSDATVQLKFERAKKLSDVTVEDYDAIFYVGGHGPVIDLAADPINTEIASKFYRKGRIVSALCHGPAALVGATDSEGKSIFAGKACTGFSNEEEEIINKVKDVPFLLESKMISLGGLYEKAEPWKPKVVVSGSLITGQNPASAKPLANELLNALKHYVGAEE